jgi:tRNA (guanine-N7-)-methyltransferase
MRQRKIKNIELKMASYRRLLAADPAGTRGRWRSLFGRGDGKLYAEIGCGKGDFIRGMALREPEAMFLGFEGQESVLYHALEKFPPDAPGADAFDNIRFCAYYIIEVGAFFADGELDGIFLNFSDPWPKDRHAKRRLTSEAKLKGYLAALAPGGFLRVKTDNDKLFAFTLAGLSGIDGFRVVRKEEDLWQSDLAEGNVATEYERKFFNLNKRIHYLEAVKR